MVNSYNPTNFDEVKLALRKTIQSIVLIGLSRSGSFNKASFYGGTALRIFYSLNKYSEDLGFTLNEKMRIYHITVRNYLLIVRIRYNFKKKT